jgi:hypothetical protein
MGLRQPWLVVLALLVPAAARAGDHKADMGGALSKVYADGSEIRSWGFQVSGAFTLPFEEHKYKFFALVADAGVQFIGGEKEGPIEEDVTQVTVAGGFRLTALGHHRVTPFGQVKAGVVDRVGGIHPSDAKFAWVFSVGLDWAWGDKDWGTRFQYDYVTGAGSISDSSQFSLGIVRRLHFPRDQDAPALPGPPPAPPKP